GDQKGEQRVLDGDLLRIGKNPDNDLVLTDTTVSREHCEITRDPKGYLLRDLGSTNGTLLDGAEIREGYLTPGAVLSVGRIELPLALQPKLLRALETRRIRRVGGSSEIAVDLRVIAASNRNLQLEVDRGKFRQDLYFRLAVVPISMPPLRQRRGDIAELARDL